MLKAPFPYFGGKSRVAKEVWRRFGNTPNYVEPFFGSGAVLLARPDDHQWWDRTETVNDLDGLLANFWRAVKHDPEAVGHWADWPVNENDLHARHRWLVGQKDSLQERLEADPDYYDVKIAGWWVWGISCWIGGRWGDALYRRLPHLGDAGSGIVSQLFVGFQPLQRRLSRVRVACGDWTRVTGPCVTERLGITGMFLDPPYSPKERKKVVYSKDGGVAADVLSYCISQTDNPMLRIALCGYDGEHNTLADDYGWSVYEWKAAGGYGNQGDGRGRANAHRERIWFSPSCINQKQTLFD